MKKLILFLPFLALLIVSAHAQSYAPATLAVPSTLLSNLTTNVSLTIDCRKTENVAIQTGFALTNSGTEGIILYLQSSVDGLAWSSNSAAQHKVVIPGAGTTPVVHLTNIATLGYGYLRLGAIVNSNTVYCTNLSIKYSLKMLNSQ